MLNETEASFVSHGATTNNPGVEGQNEKDYQGHDKNENFVFDTTVSIFGILIALFICFGNSMTILAMFRNHRLRTIPNMYIGSLAAADLLVGVLLLVQGICDVASEGYFLETEEFVCLSLMSLLFVSVAASMFSSLLVACDRYIYILYSLHYANMVTKKRSLGTIFLTWIVAILYGSIPLYTSHFHRGEGCSPTHIFSYIYMIIVHPAVFVLISITIFLLYYEIGKVAIRQNKQIRDQRERLEGSGIRRTVNTRTCRVVKVLLLVFVLFFISWSPLLILAFFEYTIHIDHHALVVGSLLAVMNSGINFLVLAAMNRDFSSEFQRMLCLQYIRWHCSLCRKNKIAPLDVLTITRMTSISRNSAQTSSLTQ